MSRLWWISRTFVLPVRRHGEPRLYQGRTIKTQKKLKPLAHFRSMYSCKERAVR